MFCLPQDLNQLVVGGLRLSWSSVLWEDTDQYTNVGNKGRADCCHFHLAAGAQGGVSCRGKGQVCSIELNCYLFTATLSHIGFLVFLLPRCVGREHCACFEELGSGGGNAHTRT